MKRILLFLCFIGLAGLTACSAEEAATPSPVAAATEPLPTDTPQPTNTPNPTETPTPEPPTATPTSTATATPIPTTFEDGATVYLVSEGGAIDVYDAPNENAATGQRVSPGVRTVVQGTEFDENGREWVDLRSMIGSLGWLPAENLSAGPPGRSSIPVDDLEDLEPDKLVVLINGGGRINLLFVPEVDAGIWGKVTSGNIGRLFDPGEMEGEFQWYLVFSDNLQGWVTNEFFRLYEPVE